MGAWGRGALPIWVVATQRGSALCLHKRFLAATSVTFFFFQLSYNYFNMLNDSLGFFFSIKILIQIVLIVLTMYQALF